MSSFVCEAKPFVFRRSTFNSFHRGKNRKRVHSFLNSRPSLSSHLMWFISFYLLSGVTFWHFIFMKHKIGCDSSCCSAENSFSRAFTLYTVGGSGSWQLFWMLPECSARVKAETPSAVFHSCSWHHFMEWGSTSIHLYAICFQKNVWVDYIFAHTFWNYIHSFHFTLAFSYIIHVILQQIYSV